MIDQVSNSYEKDVCQDSLGHCHEKVAVVVPVIPHLPLCPSCFLGYGAAVLAKKYDVDVIDFNSDLYFKNRQSFDKMLAFLEKTPAVSDALSVRATYDELDAHVLVQRESDKSSLGLSYSRHSVFREICHVKRPWGSAPDPGVF